MQYLKKIRATIYELLKGDSCPGSTSAAAVSDSLCLSRKVNSSIDGSWNDDG